MTAARDLNGGTDAGEAGAVQRFVGSGLELLDLEAELDGIEPEPGTDLSRPPA